MQNWNIDGGGVKKKRERNSLETCVRYLPFEITKPLSLEAFPFLTKHRLESQKRRHLIQEGDS